MFYKSIDLIAIDNPKVLMQNRICSYDQFEFKSLQLSFLNLRVAH